MNDDVNSEPRHPGKRLAAILDMVGMTRKELSLRTGVSEKYIEMVIHGAKDISFTFARRLEYAVGLSMQQWIDMQAQYDEYRFEQKALAGIHPDELEIPLHLVDVMPHLKRYRLLHEPKSDDDAILSRISPMPRSSAPATKARATLTPMCSTRGGRCACG